jgi:hypothetical protein
MFIHLLKYVDAEGGEIRLLQSVGIYQLTWCYVQKDFNLHLTAYEEIILLYDLRFLEICW